MEYEPCIVSLGTGIDQTFIFKQVVSSNWSKDDGFMMDLLIVIGYHVQQVCLNCIQEELTCHWMGFPRAKIREFPQYQGFLGRFKEL